MDEYKKPYCILFNSITDALENIEHQRFCDAQKVLKQAQVQAEEVFISTDGKE